MMADEGTGRVAVVVGGELIGDALYKVPVLYALRNAFPDHRITWITSETRTAYSGSLRGAVAPYLDEVLEETGIGQRAAHLLRRPDLPRYGVLIDTRSKPGPALLTRLTVRHGLFIASAARFALSDRRPAGGKRPAHVVDRLLQMVELASGRPADTSGEVVLPPDAAAVAAGLLPDGGRHVGLVPGAGGKYKCWPLDRFIATARALRDQGCRPAFLLGPDELDWLPRLKEEVPGAAFPEQSLPDAARHLRGWPLVVALGRRLALAVTNDCGTSHMLALARTPMVNLFGPTAGAKFQPRVAGSVLVEARSFGSTDMAAIPVEAVLAASRRILAAARA